MKKTVFLILLLGCFVFAAASCDPEETPKKDPVVVTDEQGSAVTDEQGNPETYYPEDTTVADDNGDGINNGGANTETGWSALIPIS